MKSSQFSKTKLMAGCVALALSSVSHAIVIDLFSVNQGTYSDATATVGDTGVVPLSGVGGSVTNLGGTIVGDNRDMFVSLLDDGGVGGEASIKVAGGAMSFSVDSLARGRGQIQWDGAEATSAIDHIGLGGVDFGVGSFKLDIKFSDAGFNFDVTIYTDATHFTTVSLLSNQHLTPTTTFIPLSAFNNPGLCGFSDITIGVLGITCGAGGVADTSNVGALVVDLDRFGGSTAIDLTLDAVNTVPEPGSVALLGIGLMGFYGATRRFKKLA